MWEKGRGGVGVVVVVVVVEGWGVVWILGGREPLQDQVFLVQEALCLGGIGVDRSVAGMESVEEEKTLAVVTHTPFLTAETLT